MIRYMGMTSYTACQAITWTPRTGTLTALESGTVGTSNGVALTHLHVLSVLVLYRGLLWGLSIFAQSADAPSLQYQENFKRLGAFSMIVMKLVYVQK